MSRLGYTLPAEIALFIGHQLICRAGYDWAQANVGRRSAHFDHVRIIASRSNPHLRAASKDPPSARGIGFAILAHYRTRRGYDLRRFAADFRLPALIAEMAA